MLLLLFFNDSAPAEIFALSLLAALPISLIVTLKVQALVLPLPSVAVQVTSVVPCGKVEPLAGVQTTVTLGQLAVAVGAVDKLLLLLCCKKTLPRRLRVAMLTGGGGWVVA